MATAPQRPHLGPTLPPEHKDVQSVTRQHRGASISDRCLLQGRQQGPRPGLELTRALKWLFIYFTIPETFRKNF